MVKPICTKLRTIKSVVHTPTPFKWFRYRTETGKTLELAKIIKAELDIYEDAERPNLNQNSTLKAANRPMTVLVPISEYSF